MALQAYTSSHIALLLFSMAKLKALRVFAIIVMIVTIAYIGKISFEYKDHYIPKFLIHNYLVSNGMFSLSENETSDPNSAKTILRKGNGILFVETTDRMEPPSLVLCAIESAARVYPDRPVAFFMKGLEDIITEEDEKRAKERFPTLSPFGNVYLFPLRMDQLFNNTPIKSWFDKVDPKKEIYWIHVLSDACRFSLVWKYGGIYMDTDVISLRPIPKDHFLGTEGFTGTSSGVFGLSSHYQLAWKIMENFVENYRGEIWGHQGPGVVTRVVKKLCGLPVFNSTDDVMCSNISYFHPQRFYPIPYPAWRRYYEVWQNLPTFNNSYALHLWNYMNNKGISMVPGSNTLVEHLYKKYCPTTYEYVLGKLT
ncbi:PREDICTED: alpha-1,4-N-acetylglucosaminyltransferase-like [Nanorana parkeri]|uniref:alpha-1,4-N-acetylglucosaminyltransferase-like n=1 Tax=Nanorana parkeri TaxID=125878 RepID=UPI00085476C1|nr:PREDICTED: alpha-1,4-N-acetylglucosaminyltransferase-like [Nanorana parkeri]